MPFRGEALCREDLANWWDDLERKLGIRAHGVDPECSPSLCISPFISARRVWPSQAPTASSLLTRRVCRRPHAAPAQIQQRCYDHLHRHACLGQDFPRRNRRCCAWTNLLDADVVFNEKLGVKGGLGDYVKQYGWPAFRQKARGARGVDAPPSYRALISLGGGVVETEACRNILPTTPRTEAPWCTLCETRMPSSTSSLQRSPCLWRAHHGRLPSSRPMVPRCARPLSSSRTRKASCWPSSRPRLTCPTRPSRSRSVSDSSPRWRDSSSSSRDRIRTRSTIWSLTAATPAVALLSQPHLPRCRAKLELIRSMESGADALEFRADLLNASASLSPRPSCLMSSTSRVSLRPATPHIAADRLHRAHALAGGMFPRLPEGVL